MLVGQLEQSPRAPLFDILDGATRTEHHGHLESNSSIVDVIPTALMFAHHMSQAIQV